MYMAPDIVKKNRAYRLSDIDRQLITLLKQDSRRTYSEMGGILSISRTTVKDRIDRLMDAGIIKRFTIELAETEQNAKTGVGAFFNLRLKRPFCKAVQETITGWPELIGSWSIAGGTDMMVYVNCMSDDELEVLRDRLARHPEVKTLWTDMVLRQWVNRSNSNLDYNEDLGPDRLDLKHAELAIEPA